jgi:hypothetical protein
LTHSAGRDTIALKLTYCRQLARLKLAM